MKRIISVFRQYIYRVKMLFRRICLEIKGVNLRKDVRIYGKVYIVGNPHNITIGQNCSLNNDVMLNGIDKLVINDNTTLSPNVHVHTGYLIEDTFPRMHGSKPISIGKNVWLATGVVVIAGVTINDNVIVAANAVVTKDLESDFLYGGIPCKKIRKLKACSYE